MDQNAQPVFGGGPGLTWDPNAIVGETHPTFSQEQLGNFNWIQEGSAQHQAQIQSHGESEQKWDPYANLFSYVDPDLAKTLGYTGPLTQTYGEGIDQTTVMSPEYKQWLDSQGYQRVLSDLNENQTLTAISKDGVVNPETVRYFKETEESLLPVLQIALMAVPGVGQALGAALGATGLGATALGNALIGGTMAELGGGDFLKGAVTSGVMPVVSQYAGLGNLGTTVSDAFGGGPAGDIIGRAVTGAGSSALGAAIGGGDVVDALLAGGLGGAAGGVSSELMGQVDLPIPLERALESAITSGLLGQDVDAMIMNALRGGMQGVRAEQPQAPGATPTSAPTGTGFSQSSGDTDWSALYNTPSELPGYMDPDGFYVQPTDIATGNPADFPVQDFGTAPQSDPNAVYDRIVNDFGGFASTWQTVGSDRVMVQDDGSAIGINTETGETYSLTPEETTQMVDAGLLNSATSGYQDAIQGTQQPGRPSQPGRPAQPGRGTQPGQGGSASPSTDNLLPLLLAMMAMGGRDGGAEPYQLANVAPGVQSGLSIIEQMYGANRG